MKSRRYKLPLIALSLSLALPAFSQSWFTPEVEKRAEDILKNMTVKERLTYIGGIDWMYTRAIPRLNVPAIKMSDGPQGVHGELPRLILAIFYWQPHGIRIWPMRSAQLWHKTARLVE